MTFEAEEFNPKYLKHDIYILIAIAAGLGLFIELLSLEYILPTSSYSYILKI